MISSDLSLVIHSPLLSALASLPVTAPACLFLSRGLGYSAYSRQGSLTCFHNTDDATHESATKLFFRYLLATTWSRLYLQGDPTRFERVTRNQSLSDVYNGFGSTVAMNLRRIQISFVFRLHLHSCWRSLES